MSASTKLVDNLEGVKIFMPGSTECDSFLKRMTLQNS
jgi:hypothetical protein